MSLGNEQDRDDGGFLSRWSRRKGLVRQGAVVAEPPVPPPVAPVARAETRPSLRHRPAPLPQPGVAADAADASAVQAAPALPAATSTTTVPATAVATADAPPPTLADVAALTADSHYARFVAPGVDRGVKNAALKKLFTDPHFNIMDGLDTYIDDYGKPDPLPAGMLRQMAQS